MNIKPKFIFAHMKTARVYGDLSYCVRRKVGAILTKNDAIISYGYNGTPKGEPNVCEFEDGTTKPEVQHAESNCIFKLVNSTETANDSIMFSTDEPCYPCAIKIVDAGIKVVFYQTPYRNHDGLAYLLKHSVKVFKVDAENESVWEHISVIHESMVVDVFGWIEQ